MHLTKKQEWMLNYVKENTNCANVQGAEYVSPTKVGRAYGESQGKEGYHSSAASPVLLKLTEKGLIERNDQGHYRYYSQLFISNKKNTPLDNELFKRYESLCKDVKYQISFIDNYYEFDFGYLEEILNEMKDLQKILIK